MAQNTDGYRKQINNVNDLPGFDKMYLFAGAPTREFDKTFRYFLSCLGNITQDGSSLLDTYHQTDPGAGPGTPGVLDLLGCGGVWVPRGLSMHRLAN